MATIPAASSRTCAIRYCCSLELFSLDSTAVHLTRDKKFPAFLQYQPHQTWSYMPNGMIRTGTRCLHASGMGAGDTVQVRPCDDLMEGQEWDLVPEYGAWNASAMIVLRGSDNLCLTPPR